MGGVLTFTKWTYVFLLLLRDYMSIVHCKLRLFFGHLFITWRSKKSIMHVVRLEYQLGRARNISSDHKSTSNTRYAQSCAFLIRLSTDFVDICTIRKQHRL